MGRLVTMKVTVEALQVAREIAHIQRKPVWEVVENTLTEKLWKELGATAKEVPAEVHIYKDKENDEQ